MCVVLSVCCPVMCMRREGTMQHCGKWGSLNPLVFLPLPYKRSISWSRDFHASFCPVSGPCLRMGAGTGVLLYFITSDIGPLFFRKVTDASVRELGPLNLGRRATRCYIFSSFLNFIKILFHGLGI